MFTVTFVFSRTRYPGGTTCSKNLHNPLTLSKYHDLPLGLKQELENLHFLHVALETELVAFKTKLKIYLLLNVLILVDCIYHI